MMSKLKIMIINGPNLNMVGIREKHIYGNESYEDLKALLVSYGEEKNIEVVCRQSNHEGDLIDWIQELWFEDYDGAVINPGGYTHTSIALMDAVKAIAPLPVVEVHLSAVNEREEYRKVSYIREACLTCIAGEGFGSYLKAIDRIVEFCGK